MWETRGGARQGGHATGGGSQGACHRGGGEAGGRKETIQYWLDSKGVR
jgi:hypothetical protein